jgi:hypothetical protein
MVQSVETTQEIQLEDIVELSMALNRVPAAKTPAPKPASLPPPAPPPKSLARVIVAAPISSIELDDDDLDEVNDEPVAAAPSDEPSVTEVMSREAPLTQDPEDLVSTRVKIDKPAELDAEALDQHVKQHIDEDSISTVPAGTLRVPSLSLAQATSALEPPKTSAPTKPAKTSTTEITQPIPRQGWSRLSRLPTPVWASISAAAAALIVGGAALIATHHSEEGISLQVRVAEREEPQTATKAMRRKYVGSEEFGRWSDVPNYVADATGTTPAAPAASSPKN